jgi:TPR repeat protein
MAVFNLKNLTTYSAGLLLGTFSLISFAMAESVQPNFQEVVKIKDCETVIRLFPDLVAENDVYYWTLSNFYEKGICFPQNYEKAFDALNKLPENEFGFQEFKLGQYYSNGWGVPKNQKRARELFEQGIEKELLRHDNFSDVRFGLDLILGTKTFPPQLEEIISFYEQVNWTVDQKYDFAVKFINNPKSNDTLKQQAYYFLIRLVNQYHHAPSAYLIAKWYENNEDDDGAQTYFFEAAIRGHAQAQAYVGRSYFFENLKIVDHRVAYEMLYRAHLAGEVSSEEISKAEQNLNKWEIQRGREEAAKPLPIK